MPCCEGTLISTAIWPSSARFSAPFGVLPFPAPEVDYTGLYAAAAREVRLTPVERFVLERIHLGDGVRPRVIQRVVMAAASLVMLVVMTGGLAYAANGAKPGDLLYGLDRAIEALGIGDGGADERLAETMAVAALEAEVSDRPYGADGVVDGGEEAAAGKADEHEASGALYDDDLGAIGAAPGDDTGPDPLPDPSGADDATSTSSPDDSAWRDPDASGSGSRGETPDNDPGADDPLDGNGAQSDGTSDDTSDDPGPGDPTTTTTSTTTTTTTTTTTIAQIGNGGDCDDGGDDDREDNGDCDD